MGRKFMIVKPKQCCGYSESIGYVGTAVQESLLIPIVCTKCKAITPDVLVIQDSESDFIPVSRIIWLPDEQDVLDHDEQLELTA